MHPPQHGRKNQGKHGGIKHWLQTRPHGSSLPSFLLANVQVLDNKLDDLRVRISVQRDIRKYGVLCYIETPGILDSAIKAGRGHCFAGHGHQPAGHGGLGDDAVLLRLPLHAVAGSSSTVLVGMPRASPTSWSSTGTGSEGIATAIMNSNCLVFFFPCCGREADTGYTGPALRG